MERSDTDSEYESGPPGPPTKKKLRTEIVHKKCLTTDFRQDFKPSETQSTDHESRRVLPLQIIGDIVIEHDNNRMEVDDGNLTIDPVQKPRQIIGVRLNRAPKSSAERGREFRARKALLKQQCKQQQEPDAIVDIATEDIRSAGPSENNQVPEPSKITTMEKRAKSAEATRRWRERKKGVSESSNKQAKTAAQRMREYRERKKIFPKNEIEREKWRRIIAKERGDEFFKPNDSSVVCSRHIPEKYVYLTKKGFCKLKKGALPRIETDASATTSTLGSPGNEPSTSRASDMSFESPLEYEVVTIKVEPSEAFDTNTWSELQPQAEEQATGHRSPSSSSGTNSVLDSPSTTYYKRTLGMCKSKIVLKNKQIRNLQKQNQRLMKRNKKLKEVVAVLKKKLKEKL